MAVTILKNTRTLSVVKATATADTVSLAALGLASDVVATPKASIAFVQWLCSPAATDVITISRGGTTILTLYQNGEMDMGGNGGYLDNIGEASDLLVTIVGTGQVYLTLRKTSGYTSKLEPEYYGPYDNPNAVGS